MRKLILSTIGVAAMFLSGAASAIPVQIGINLFDPTGNSTTCLAGCTGTITVDLTTGAISTSTNGYYDIVDINIDITDGNPGTSTGLVFDTLTTFDDHYVLIENNSLTDIFAATSKKIFNGYDHTLSLNGRIDNNSDWIINGGRHGLNAGGSAVAIPEPSALALLGIGLVGFATARRLRKKTS